MKFFASEKNGTKQSEVQINLQFIDLVPYINIMELLRHSDLLETKKMHKLYHLIISSLQKMQEYTAQLICGTMVAQVARVFVQPQAAVQKPIYVVTDSLTQDDYGARPR